MPYVEHTFTFWSLRIVCVNQIFDPQKNLLDSKSYSKHSKGLSQIHPHSPKAQIFSEAPLFYFSSIIPTGSPPPPPPRVAPRGKGRCPRAGFSWYKGAFEELPFSSENRNQGSVVPRCKRVVSRTFLNAISPDSPIRYF